MSTERQTSWGAAPAYFHLAFLASGVAGLAYQMVWLRMFALGLGHELPSTLAIVSAFFGGLALGSWSMDRTLARADQPARIFAGLELLIGTWAVMTALFIPALCNEMVTWIGISPSALRHWSIAFCVPFLVLLPATFAMGASLPAIDRVVAPLGQSDRRVGGLYAANTLGAVLGVLITTFVLLPAFGFRTTIFLLAPLNLISATIAYALGRRLQGDVPEATPVSMPRAMSRAGQPDGQRDRRLLASLFLTGLLGIGYELVAVRVLSETTANTVYSFATALAVYLLGTALGGALYQRFHRVSDRARTSAILFTGLCASTALGIWALASADSIYDRMDAAAHGQFAGRIYAEVWVAALVFLVPTLFMGATFSHLVQEARSSKGGVGLGAAVNTLGGTFSSVVFGVALLPHLGAKATLTLLTLGYAAMIPMEKRRFLWVAALPLALWVQLPPELKSITLQSTEERVIAYRQGLMSSVAVLETPRGYRKLRINDRFQMGGTGDALYERRQGHLPLLLHPSPERALFLGLGTGITFGATRYHPTLEADGVELIPELLELQESFRIEDEPALDGTRSRIFVSDARRFVRSSPEAYDVIVADLFHPARDGGGTLYTLEHFQAVSERLSDGGLFCQWLPVFQMNETTLKLVVRTFLEVFPEARAVLLGYGIRSPALGLIGMHEPITYAPTYIKDRLSSTELLEEVRKRQLHETHLVLGTHLAGRAELARFAGAGPLNTDDHPLVVFQAPKQAPRTLEARRELLLRVLDQLDWNPIEVLASGKDETARLADNLRAFADARDAFLAGRSRFDAGDESAGIDAFVESARLSLYFPYGYNDCYEHAKRIASRDPQGARMLLERLVEVRPERPFARQLLEEWSSKGL